MSDNLKLAVLIDGDNAQASVATEMFAEIAKLGTASVKRIYGDWSAHQLQNWGKILLDHALTPVQQFAYTKGKNATDMSMIIDAMDLLYSGTFDGFCLVSSDSDFTPLAMRIRASGLKVIGFGKETTPLAFKQACDRFIYTENLQEKPGAAVSLVTQGKTVLTNPDTLLFKAIKETADDGSGWSAFSHIGNYLNQINSDFDTRSYGYKNLTEMLHQLNGLQFREDSEKRRYCRKIPYRDAIAFIKEALERQQSNAGEWKNIAGIESYVSKRFVWKDYGFDTFIEFLKTVTTLELNDAETKFKWVLNNGK